MECEFSACIYCFLGKCTLNKITINVLGKCNDKVTVSFIESFIEITKIEE